MSSFDRFRRSTLLAALCLSTTILSACQVQPLYGEQTTGALSPLGQSSIEVAEVGDRVGQEVRNHLIFLLNGGAGQPASPRYRLDMTVSESVIGILRDPIDGQPTGQNLQLTAQYQLVEVATDRQVAVRSQSVTTSYDTFDQAFADIRAARDAENRAARELAERVRADLAIILRGEVALGSDQGA